MPLVGQPDKEAVPYHLEWANHKIALVRN